MIIKKRTVLIFSTFLAIIIAFITLFSALSNLTQESFSSDFFKVVIDAGHGGVDGGVSGVKTGVKESDLNLILAKELASFLNEEGIKTVLTRSTKAGLYGTATSNRKRKDMLKRKEIILDSAPNLVISLHMNYYSVSDRRGAQAFFDEKNENSKKVALAVQSALNDLPTNERKYSALKGDYYILNSTNYPAVLIECGFLSNPQDEELLISREYREIFCQAVLNGISIYRINDDI
ncbi:MAG: N-acetylmuramoyl-L-alanine amidase [Clostridia bacterium]|nr:N-acetylmuramoyl-L-alanine amidase [Clostridia bacterium]